MKKNALFVYYKKIYEKSFKKMSSNCKSDFKIGQVQIEFSEKKMTAYGGFSLLAKFFENIGLRSAVESFMPVQEKSPNSLGIFAKVLSFILTAIAGGKRFSHLVFLQHSLEIFGKLFGVKRLPKSTTAITRFFNKIKSWQKAEEMAEGVWNYLFGIIPWNTINHDYISFDSSVVTRFGQQEGAKCGYNPKKPGRPSHNPICAFLSNSRFILNIWNRAGNARSAENVVEFAKQTCVRLGDKISIDAVLADSGFYEKPFIDFLEENGHKYVIAVRFYGTIQKEISGITNWQKVDNQDDIEIADFMFCHKSDNWERPRRYFVVRRKIKQLKPEPIGKQLKLFPELDDVNTYRYSAFLTNFDSEALDLWRLYRRRCDDENRIKEIKEDFGLEGFCLKNFYATEAAMLLRVFIYNLYNLFRIVILPKHSKNKRSSTIRFEYFVIPGILGASGNQSILRLGISPGKQRCKFKYLLYQVSRWFPPSRGELQCI